MHKFMWLVGIVAFFFFIILFPAITRADINYKFFSFDVPGAEATSGAGINDKNVIAGEYSFASGFGGFIYDGTGFQTSILTLSTYFRGINNHGEVVGFAEGSIAGQGNLGFIYDGSYHLKRPNGNSAAFGINDAGELVGRFCYNEPFQCWGYHYNGSGYKTLNVAGALSDINNAGNWVSTGGTVFIDGKFTSIGYVLRAINDTGVIVVEDPNSTFPKKSGLTSIRQPSEFIEINYPGAYETIVRGVNNLGSITGHYRTSFNSDSHGFWACRDQNQDDECDTGVIVDPIPDLVDQIPPQLQATPDYDRVATFGTLVDGIAADGVARVILRIPASVVGEQLAVSVMNSVPPSDPAPSQSIDEDGGLSPIDVESLPQTSILVSAVDTKLGPMAFAVYHAPLEFSRPGGVDDNKTLRDDVLIWVTPPPNPDTPLHEFPLKIVRPPVILVHGLWDSSDSWDSFSPLINKSEIFVKTVNYSQPISVSSGTPDFTDPGVLSLARKSALGFGSNTSNVLGQIKNFIKNYKTGPVFDDFKINPNAGLKVAAVQADIIAHSMGGDIARSITLDSAAFLGVDTFEQGSIHKLITIGTPHLGTPLATELLNTENSCVRGILARRGNIAFNQAVLASGPVNGAVFDLRGDGFGGALSPAIQGIQQSTWALPTAMIAGVMSSSQLAGLDCTLCAAQVIKILCAGNPLANNLTSALWPTVFGQDSDAIVPLSSQLNNLSGSTFTAIHSPGTEKLSFNGPSEIETASGIPNEAVNLLSIPSTSSPYILLP